MLNSVCHSLIDREVCVDRCMIGWRYYALCVLVGVRHGGGKREVIVAIRY
jgi:hypothetical protein